MYIEFQRKSLNSDWENSIEVEILPLFLCTKSKQGQITPQIQVTGLPALPLWTPLVIVNNYSEFQVDTFDSVWEKDFFIKILSRKREITLKKCWIELSCHVNWSSSSFLHVYIEFQRKSFKSDWENSIEVEILPLFLCTKSKQGQITPQIQVTGLPALPFWTPLVIVNNYSKFQEDTFDSLWENDSHEKLNQRTHTPTQTHTHTRRRRSSDDNTSTFFLRKVELKNDGPGSFPWGS